MCGINGFNFPNYEQAELMNEAIRYRGPDDEGVFTDESVTLGNVRLSIFDLSKAGKQPMVYRHGGECAIISYNGEVYNFAELRKILEDKGYKFNSRTDTEVVLASYLEYGYDCVRHFDGMWAFVIYDPAKRILFCSRDRAGKKPFYYYLHKGNFIFSSELRGILTHDYLCLNKIENINREAVDLYFELGFIPAPYTIYKNTFKLEARQNATFDLAAKQMIKWYYYSLPQYEPLCDHERLIHDGKNLLEDSVRLRTIADVPVGVFLSGGLDSCTTLALMEELDGSSLHTFSIGFEGSYDETPFIDTAKTYFGTNHHHHLFTQADFEQLLDTYPTLFDEPLSDFSAFPTYILCKKAREYVTVALSGDGGDEIFGGYPEHVMGYRMDMIKSMPKLVRTVLSKMPAKENLNGYSSLFLLKKAFRASLFDPTLFYARALEEEVPTPEIANQWRTEKLGLSVQYSQSSSMAELLRTYDLLYNTLADNYLAKVDRMSMANSLEVRCPFLDYRLIEFSQKIPVEWKVDLFRTKKLLREIVKDMIPGKIVRRRKRGFATPLPEWISNKMYKPSLVHALNSLKLLRSEMYPFLSERVLTEDNRLYRRYKARLLLFGKWMDHWILN